MNAPKKISSDKLKKLASLSLLNSLRLHFDSILLYKNNSFPSAFQLSVLALEEFGKSKAVEHYVWNTIVNKNPHDPAFERKFIDLLYYHPWKQGASIGRELFDYSRKYVDFIRNKGLENKKQKSIYVGLEKVNGKVNLKGKVSFPWAIKSKDSKQQISLLNDIFKEIIFLIEHQGMYFDIEKMDEILKEEHRNINAWQHRSGIKRKIKYIINSQKSGAKLSPKKV